MSLGKPVIGYLREEWFEVNPHWRECPIVNADPDNIAEALKPLVTDWKLRNELGRKGRAFVERYHDYRSFSDEMKELYWRLWRHDSASS